MSVKDISASEWEARVESAKNPVLVEFVTQTCPNCRAMAPVVEELSEKFAARMEFFRLDVQRYQTLAARFGVMGVPTFKVFCKGKPIAELVGEMYPALLSRLVEETLEHGNACAEKSTRVSYEMSGYG